MPEPSVNIGSATVLKETDKAILVEGFGWDGEFWVPKSVISDESEVWSLKNGEGDLIVQRWWAVEHGHVDKE